MLCSFLFYICIGVFKLHAQSIFSLFDKSFYVKSVGPENVCHASCKSIIYIYFAYSIHATAYELYMFIFENLRIKLKGPFIAIVVVTYVMAFIFIGSEKGIGQSRCHIVKIIAAGKVTCNPFFSVFYKDIATGKI